MSNLEGDKVTENGGAKRKNDSDPGAVRIPLLGLMVERKTDALAAAAFTLALLSALTQVFLYVKGVNVSMIGPDRVFLIVEPDRNPGTNAYVVRVAAEMGYYNTGAIGYNAVVGKETVSFEFGGQRYVQGAVGEFMFSDTDQNDVLERRLINAARMAPIPAGSAVGRQVYFGPLPIPCEGRKGCKPDMNYLSQKRFLEGIRTMHSMKFDFSAEMMNGNEKWTDSCTAEFGDEIIAQMVLNGWAVVACSSANGVGTTSHS